MHLNELRKRASELGTRIIRFSVDWSRPFAAAVNNIMTLKRLVCCRFVTQRQRRKSCVPTCYMINAFNHPSTYATTKIYCIQFLSIMMRRLGKRLRYDVACVSLSLLFLFAYSTFTPTLYITPPLQVPSLYYIKWI